MRQRGGLALTTVSDLSFLDTHVHLWDVSRGDYGWLKPANQLLYRNYLPEDLSPHLAMHAVDGVIAVQAAATLEETAFLLKLAERHDWIRGVVGYIDLTSHSAESVYDRMRRHPKFSGIRYTVKYLPADELVLSPAFIQLMTKMANDGFPIDLLMSPVNIDYLIRILERVPHAKLVMNHVGGPVFQEETDPDWSQGIRQLAQFEHVYCKLSGMISQTGREHPERARNYVSQLFDVFGDNRLLFGSDWPVSLSGGSYSDVIEYFYNVLPKELNKEQLKRIRKGNAQAVYSIM